MSTYTTLHNTLKETINVDFHTRETNQEVKLYNGRNEFWGTFYGKLSASSANLRDAILDNPTLNDAIINGGYILLDDGTKLNFSDLTGMMYDLSIENRDITLSIYGIDERVNSISAQTLRSISQISSLSDDIKQESEERYRQDTDIRYKMSKMENRLSSRDNEIESELTSYILSQKTNLSALSSSLTSFSEDNKHYEFNLLPNTTEPYLLQDFKVNTIKTNAPYSYVFINDNKVGYTLVRDDYFEGSNLTAIDLVIYDDNKYCKKLIPRTYYFTTKNPENYTGYEDYKITWNFGEFPKIEFKLTGRSDVKYFQLEFEPDGTPASDIEIPGSRIIDYQLSGYTYGPNILNTLLSGTIELNIPDEEKFKDIFKFNGKTFTFGQFEREKYYESDNTLIKIDDREGYSLGSIILKRDFNERYYKALTSTIDSKYFGRIYEDQISYDSENEIKSLVISVDNTIVETYPTGEEYELNEENSFKTLINSLGPDYVELSDNCIVIRRENKIYSCALEGFNVTTGLPTGIDCGKVEIETPNIKDITSSSIESFKLTIKNSGSINGEYTLTRDSTLPCMYKCFQKIEDGLSISIKYDNVHYDDLINFIVYGPTEDRGAWLIEKEEQSVDDRSSTLFQTEQIKETGEKIDCNLLDTGDTKYYKLVFDITDQRTVKDAESYQMVQTGYVPQIFCYVPEFKWSSDNKGREFILDLDIGQLRGRTLSVILENELPEGGIYPYSFRYQSDILSSNSIKTNHYFEVNGQKNIFRFQEISRNEFQIEDLNDVEVNSYLSSLSSYCYQLCTDIQLSVENLSARIEKNSNDISALSAKVKNGVNYRGVVQVIDDDGYIFHLSNLFYYSTGDYEFVHRKYGWEYPRPEYTDKDFELQTGYMFYVDRAPRGVTTTRWIIDGLELERGDYIIVKNDNVKLCDVVSSDLNVIDAIESDKIIVDDIVVHNVADISSVVAKQISTDYLSARLDQTYFTDVLSTASEICASIQSQILSNDGDITQISTDLSGLSSLYHQTFIDIEDVPNKLLIRDEANDDIYKLTICHGLLAIKKIDL